MTQFGTGTEQIQSSLDQAVQIQGQGLPDIDSQTQQLAEILSGSGIIESMYQDADFMSVQSEELGVFGATGRYISESAVGAAVATKEALVDVATELVPALIDEQAMSMARSLAERQGLSPEMSDYIVDISTQHSGFKSMADWGARRKERREAKEPSYFRDSDIWIKPEDLAGVLPSIVAGVSVIATSGLSAPVAVPVMAAGVAVPAAQAADSLYGDYAEVLAENPELDYDPKVAAALGAVVALETLGTKMVTVDLPTMMAKKAFRRGLAEAAKEKAKAGFFRKFLGELGAAGIDGIEEIGEEELEALVGILYQPEFEELRKSILSGDIDRTQLKQVWDLITSVDVGKTFVLGSGSYGVTRPAAALRQRADVAKAGKQAERARLAEEIAAEVRAGGEVPIGPGVEDIPAEDITPEGAEPAAVSPVTLADIDNDEFMDRLIDLAPDAVDEILSKSKTRGGNTLSVWEGLIPEGVKTNRAQRQALWERLKAAKDRRAGVEPVAGEVEIGDETLADLRRESEQLTQELIGIQSSDPDFFEDNPAFIEASTRLYDVEQQIEELTGAEPEFSTTAPVTSKRVDVSTLQVEPDTQMGSMPGGIAEQQSTGRRFYIKRYQNREQTRNEAVANRLYDAAGIRVSNAGVLTENGEVVGIASELVAGASEGQGTDVGDGLIIDAWLANWDVVGAEGDNLLVDAEGRTVRVDQGGALTTRAKGEPKGERFGDTVGEVETLPAMNEALANVSPSQLRRGFQALESVSEQDIKRIVKENSTGDTASDNRLISTLIKRRRDLLSRQDEIVASADAEFSTTAASLELEAVNRSGPDKFAALTPEQEANLTDGQRQIAENARRRLGKEVVFVHQTSGIQRNGFITSRDSDRIYIVVPVDTQASISRVAKRRGMSERQVREAYEVVLIQTVLHENYHLREGVDGAELTDDEKAARAAVDAILKVSARVRYNNRIRDLFDMYAAEMISASTLESEIRAEAATDLQSLQQSGVEALFLDRGLLRNAMARIRMLTNRFGGPKEVRIMTSMVRNMSRDGESLVSSPDTTGEVVEFSTNYVPASQRPNYNAAAGYAANEYVPAVAYQDGTAQQIADAHKKNKRGLYLSPVNVKELQSEIEAGTAIVRITGDGTAGYILRKTGIGWDIQGVFNVGNINGAGKAAIVDAISLGGNTLDCFDGYLPELYSHFGFAATHELEFDPDQAPTGWQDDEVLSGTPNVVLMTFTGVNRDKQAIADLAKYYAENKDKRPAREAPEADSWPSDAQRTESPNVQEVRQAAGRANDATSEIVRRVLTPEFSTSTGTVIRSHIPYLDYATVIANPTPEGVLNLFVRYRALNTFGKKPSAADINEESVAREMARIGLPADDAIAKHVAKHYIDAASVAPASELRGEGEAFGPRGRVENELSNLFDSNPSPTAAELASVTGSPKPRTKHPVIQHKPKGKGDREQMAKKFVENSESWLKKAGVQYTITKNDLEIERLLEENGAVIFDGEGGPAIHVRAEVMDRHKTTRPYADIKDATVKAIALGHHNWYREFGREFAQIFGEEALVEAAFVFGVTSAQSPVEVNLADTLFVMRAVREHRRLGKPWTVEALAESMVGVRRRSKYTKTGETLAFISGGDATRMAEFYVNGLGDSDVSIKTRTYSGSVAAAGVNAFYPYSVQDRHMAAMFGFMPGSIDPTSGEYKTDKVFKNPEESRYASYLTQRLSMEEGLRGLTPSQIQSALWFYIKSGQSIYADAEVKENAGLLKIYETQNPDITSGTLGSAIRFAEYELADLRAEMAADPTPIDSGDSVPGFTSFKFGHHDYTAGQAHARRLSEIMEGEASRVVLSGYPTIQAPGLTNPLYPMREAAMNEMSQNILSAVTETDGSIRILNDLGVPHTPLMSGVGAVGTNSYRALHLVPLVGSITDPSAARIIGSIVGLGTMQPRMATVQHTPDGKGVTLRVRQSNGNPLTPRQLDQMSKSLGVFGRGESEVIQMSSPRGDFIDVTIIPESGSVDNATVSSKFDQVSKEIMNETGLQVRAEAFRTNVEIIESKNYAGVISESGLAAGRPSDLLGRVLREVSTPTLSVLRSSGYQFNRQQFADGHGIDSAVVEASIPMAEFSTASTSIGVMPIEDQNRLRTEAGGPTFVASEGRLGEMAAEELRWWSSLQEDDRALIRSWVSGTEVPVVISDPLREMLEFAEPRIAGEFWTAMRITGTIGHGSLAADCHVYSLSMFDRTLDVGANSTLEPDQKAEVSKQVALGLSDGLQSVLGMQNDLSVIGFGPAEEILVDDKGNWRGQEIRYATVSDAGLIPSDRWNGNTVVTVARIPDSMADDYKDSSRYLRGRDGSNWYVFGSMVQDVSSIDSIVSSIVSNSEITPYMASREIGNSLTRRVMPLMDRYPRNLRKIAGLYNRTVEALAKAPKIQGRTYRGHFVSAGEFKSVFREGDVFRTEAPASMSNGTSSAFDFMGGSYSHEGRMMAEDTLGITTLRTSPSDMDPDVLPIFFVIEAKTARIVHTASLYGDKSSRVDQPTLLGYATYPTERQQADVAGYVEDELLSENLSQYEGRIGDAANILVEEGHLSRVEADELVANYGVLKPSSVGSGEFESVSMPGSSYRVDKIVNNVVYLTEVEISPEQGGLVFPEFSTGSRRSSSAIEPEMSTTSSKSIMWHRDKGVRERLHMDARRTVQDRFIELDYLQRDIEEAFGGPLDIDEDPIVKIRSMPGETAHKAQRFSKRVVEPISKAIAREGLTQAEMGQYCAALHALDANRELRAASSAAAAGTIDCGISDAEANRIIADFQKRPNIANINAIQRRIVGIGRQNLRMAKNAGLISQKQFDDMSTAYPNYIPFWDAFDPKANADATGDQFSVPSEIFKARTGRTANALAGNTKFFADRLAAIADQRYRVIRKGLNNNILKRLLKLSAKSGGETLEVFKPGLTTIVDKSGRHRSIPDTSWMRDPTIFRVMVDGVPILLQVKNEKLANAMRSANVSASQAYRLVMRPFQMYSSLFRYFTTQFGNPDFTFTNPVRDIQTAAASVFGENPRLSAYKNGKAKNLSMVDRVRIIAKSGLTLGIAWGTVLGLGTEQSRRDYAKYRALGGRQGVFKDQNPEASRRRLREIAMAGQPVTSVEGAYYAGKRVVRGTVGQIAEVWEHVNTMFDDGIRFATYRQLVREGVHPEKAIETTRDLTVDFSRMGTGVGPVSGEVINALYIYSNATVQGTTKTMRLLKSKAGASVVGAYFVAGALSELWNDDEEDRDGNLKNDWDQIPDFYRDADMHIRIPAEDGDTETTYFKIPVAYGLDVPFVMGRRLIRMMQGKETIGESSMAILNAALNQFVPGGFGATLTTDPDDSATALAKALAPDMLDPAISLWKNKDWRNNSIYNEPFPTDTLQNRSEMGRDQTAWYWKDLAGMLNTATGGDEVMPGAVSIQPEIIPYVLRSIFGGTGAAAGRVMDGIERSLHDDWIRKHYPNEADRLISDLGYAETPVLRRFLTTTNQPYQDSSSYYEYKKISDQADQAIREYDELGMYEKAEAVEAGAQPALAIRENIKKIKALQKEMRNAKAEMQQAGMSSMEIVTEMRRYAADIKELQREAAMIYREEEQYAATQAGTD